MPKNAIVILLTVLGLLVPSCAPAAPPPAKTSAPAAPTVSVPAAKPAPPVETKPGAPTPSPKPTADQPRYGGILTLGASADPPSLDPIREASGTLFNIFPAYSGLLQYDPLDNEKIVPDLAERWERSGDGMSYTFYLRKDAKWHDGKPFTSADAAFSVDNQRKFSARKKDLLSAISGAEPAGEYAVKVSAKQPSASIAAWLAVGNMAMAPKHIYEAKGDMRKEVVGTGPFKLKGYSSGVSMELVKNEGYFVSGRPYLDGITAYVIRDRGTLLAAFRTGRIKMPVPYIYVTPGEAKIIEKNVPQAIVQPFKSLRFGMFAMKMTDKPWDDVRVRRAVFLATDRQAALKAIGEGEGTLGITNIAGQWALPEEELLKQPGFRQPKDADIAEAKRLLAEAGFAAGLETRILTRPGYGAALAVAEFMTAQLAKIGIRATVDVQESAAYLDRLDRGAYETITTFDGIDITDPDAAAQYSVKGNRYFITDEKLHELFDKQARTTDPVERKRLVLDLQHRVSEVAPYVLTLWFDNYIPRWPEVRNYKAGVGQHNNSKYQDVWLAK
ncbi:MAG: ABC transporter substrate-binding protein [Chloroflexi bacterium]|nr:ABC transporter substrate-binding protein [Chloroflexota bacterium]